MRRLFVIGLMGILGAFMATEARAASIGFDTSQTSDIPGLTGFATDGSQMDGLLVTVYFVNGGQETVAWADTAAPQSGQAAGTGWSLSLTGDTFGADWTYTGAAISGFTLDGRTGNTVFDTTFGGATGTAGSELGITYTCNQLGTSSCDNANVTYGYQVSIGGADPVGDLWQVVDVRFGADGGLRGFSFDQDTDNDVRINNPVPEPGTMLLLGSGLTGLVLRKRRQRG